MCEYIPFTVLKTAFSWLQLEVPDNLLKTEKGKLRPLYENAVTLFRENAEWEGVLGLNIFNHRLVNRRPVPGSFSKDPNPSYWTDHETLLAMGWLQRQGCFINSSSRVHEAITTVAHDPVNEFHPVRDYLRECRQKWDGQERLPYWLHMIFGAPDDEITRAFARCWLISAAARVMHSGIKADHVLALLGIQGTRKSSAIEILARDTEWYATVNCDLQGKDARLALHGKWIIELAELASVRKSQREQVKTFLSERIDHFRPPYGRVAEDFPRSCVFIATTNDYEFLNDPTGGRRFWPVECSKIDLDMLREIREQLWGEALAHYEQGEPWWLTDEEEKLARELQADHYEPGPRFEIIRDYVERGHGRVTIREIWETVLGIPRDRVSQRDMNEIADALKYLGWRRKQIRDKGKVQWWYVSPTPLPPMGKF